MGQGRLGYGAIQLIEQPLGHGDLRGGGVDRHALLIIIGGDLLDVRDGADYGRDLLKLLGGGGVGEVEGAVAILGGCERGKKRQSPMTIVRMGVPFRTLDATDRANVQNRSRDQGITRAGAI